MSKQQNFEVLVRVNQETLPHLLNVLTPQCELVSVKACEGVVTRAPMRFVNGKRNKGISAKDLILETLPGPGKQTISFEKLQEVFVARGFAKNSVSPALSGLIAEKLVHSPQKQTYQLTKSK